MQEKLTLESVAKILELWRSNKPKSFSKIPQDIKDLIKSISKEYSYKQLSQTLNIYGAALTDIINIKPRNKKNNKINFIELPKTMTSNPKLPSQLTNTSCTLRHPNGTTMTIEIPIQHLTAIIKDFICCN